MGEEYNYEDFVMTREEPWFGLFRSRLHVGEHAPDGTLLRLDDQASVQLRDFWAVGPVVVEFGSLT